MFVRIKLILLILLLGTFCKVSGQSTFLEKAVAIDNARYMQPAGVNAFTRPPAAIIKNVPAVAQGKMIPTMMKRE